jgi:two-component system LytT family response regulator
MTRILIADDEAPARARLRQILAAHLDLEIVGEAETGPQTMELAAQLKPDLILLDIQMPGCSGIDVVASLPHPRPHVIFCTAFDQHAVDAFELHAVDYLLKPISRARLAKALERVRTLESGHQETVLDQAALTKLVGDGVQYWMDPTLNELEQRINPARFFRVSRAALINLNAVAEVFPMPGGSGEVLLKNGQRLEVSRRRFRDLLQSLDGSR